MATEHPGQGATLLGWPKSIYYFSICEDRLKCGKIGFHRYQLALSLFSATVTLRIHFVLPCNATVNIDLKREVQPTVMMRLRLEEFTHDNRVSVGFKR